MGRRRLKLSLGLSMEHSLTWDLRAVIRAGDKMLPGSCSAYTGLASWRCRLSQEGGSLGLLQPYWEDQTAWLTPFSKTLPPVLSPLCQAVESHLDLLHASVPPAQDLEGGTRVWHGRSTEQNHCWCQPLGREVGVKGAAGSRRETLSSWAPHERCSHAGGVSGQPSSCVGALLLCLAPLVSTAELELKRPGKQRALSPGPG